MNLSPLPENAEKLMDWPWGSFEPYYRELIQRRLDADSLAGWLKDWSDLAEQVNEAYWRFYVEVTVDTTDEDAVNRYGTFLDQVYPQAQAADQQLKQKLLASGLEPPGFEIPLRNMKAEAGLFRESNLPLLSEVLKLGNEYEKVIAAQTVEWDGQERTLPQLQTVYQESDRERRERAWCLSSQRQLADREAIDDLWVEALQFRRQIAANAGLDSYRDYRWQQQLRFDYQPEDCLNFHQAIAQVVVPVALQVYQKRQQRLGLDSLRPWDLNVDVFGLPPLRPYASLAELEAKTADIFRRVDAKLGDYFDRMRIHGWLDLENRKGKAPGGYCTEFAVERRPFIFANSVGLHEDVQTLLHEGGHAFHVFESAGLPYFQQRGVPLEFAEVASMGMEFLSAPYLHAGQDGFYTPEQAARARIEHIEGSLLFWPYMAVVDAFQHWVYTNLEAAMDPANCDARWADLWQRFMPGIDWSGLEAEMATGWQRKAHIHTDPFYYIEYGLALLGAVQVWRNAIIHQNGAVQAYRRALALGGTATLPDLYASAGARFAFDAGTLGMAVELMMETIETLEGLATSS